MSSQPCGCDPELNYHAPLCPAVHDWEHAAIQTPALDVPTGRRMPKQKPGRSKQDYQTPGNFLTAVKTRFGIDAFQWDFAADQTNTVSPYGYWNAHDNSLSKPSAEWIRKIQGGWGWLNPPYADIGPWAERCLMAGARGGRICFLVPAGIGSNWYRDFVDGHAHVLALNGRLSFDGKAPYPKDCILAVYGLGVRGGFEVWDWEP